MSTFECKDAQDGWWAWKMFVGGTFFWPKFPPSSSAWFKLLEEAPADLLPSSFDFDLVFNLLNNTIALKHLHAIAFFNPQGCQLAFSFSSSLSAISSPYPGSPYSLDVLIALPCRSIYSRQWFHWCGPFLKSIFKLTYFTGLLWGYWWGRASCTALRKNGIKL